MPHFETCPLCGASPLRLQANSTYMCPGCDKAFSMGDLQTWYIKRSSPSALEYICKRAHISVRPITGIWEKTVSFGTGTVIAPNGIMLTCAHVLTDAPSESGNVRNLCSSVSIQGDKDSVTDARILDICEPLDLALVQSERLSSVPPLPMARKQAPVGAYIGVVGNGRGEGISVLDGVVSDPTRLVNNRELMMISAPVTSGYSGGPVLDEKGRMVGMVTGGRTGETHMNYAIPIDVIMGYLQQKL